MYKIIIKDKILKSYIIFIKDKILKSYSTEKLDAFT